MITEQYLISKGFKWKRNSVWEHFYKGFYFKIELMFDSVVYLSSAGTTESRIIRTPEQLEALYSALTVGEKL